MSEADARNAIRPFLSEDEPPSRIVMARDGSFHAVTSMHFRSRRRSDHTETTPGQAQRRNASESGEPDRDARATSPSPALPHPS